MKRPSSSSHRYRCQFACVMLAISVPIILTNCSRKEEERQAQKPLVKLAEHPKVTLAIEPKYHTAAAFAEGLALVSNYGSSSFWNYISPDGEVVIQGAENWYLAGPFSEGLAAVGILPEHRLGGNDPTEFLWKRSLPSEFLSIEEHEQWMVGSNRFSLEQVATKRASEENAQLTLTQRFAFRDSKWGYVDKKGEWVIKPQWAGAKPFHDGWGVVSRRVGLPSESSYNRKYNPDQPERRIRTVGDAVPHDYQQKYRSNPTYANLPFEYSDSFVSPEKPDGVLPEALVFKLPAFVVSEEENGVELKDKPGWDRIVTLSNFFQGEASLSSGFCEQEPPEWVAVVDTKLSILKQRPGDSSKTIAEARTHKGGENLSGLTSAGPNERLTVSKQIAGVGFTDQTGAVVIKAEWQDAQPFSCGAAAVKRDGKWGYINKAGELVTELKWDEAKPFKENMAAIKLGEKWGYLKITDS